MSIKKLPVFNDPIYGFISIESPLIFELLKHPYFQRLRRIAQMGLSSLVYPGARHSRFEHALGAVYLMQSVVDTLRRKGVTIDQNEKEALCVAILLHDIGHGPFSHAMENTLFVDVHHEELSLGFMHLLNDQFSGRLSLAIEVYKNQYKRPFMHQLIASQLDVDRLDYLKRDSFYTGATEGNINSQRLIAMLNVVDDQLVVEEKGLFSVEKFIMARRLMYWQVYLHKTGLGAELLLSKLLAYVRELLRKGETIACPKNLLFFLNSPQLDPKDQSVLHQFSQLDDTDIFMALKQWQQESDPILSSFSKRILNRQLLKVKLRDKEFTLEEIENKKNKLRKMGVQEEDLSMYVFSGTLSATAYSPEKDPIFMLTKSKKIIPFASFSSLFKTANLTLAEEKAYLCFANSI